MEVPDCELKGIRRLSNIRLVGPSASVYAAIMLNPGAMISG
jgi:hypothetical protein